jgi:hypothetical protein
MSVICVRWLFEAAGLLKDRMVADNESDFATRLRDSWSIADISKSGLRP